MNTFLLEDLARIHQRDLLIDAENSRGASRGIRKQVGNGIITKLLKLSSQLEFKGLPVQENNRVDPHSKKLYP